MQNVYHRAPIGPMDSQGYRRPYKIGGCGCLGADTTNDTPKNNKNLYIALSVGALVFAAILGYKFTQDMKK